MEGEDVAEANRLFAASQTSFDRWFKEIAQKATGVDFSQPLPAGLSEPTLETPIVSHKPSTAVALPVATGRSEDLKRWAKELTDTRREDFSDLMRRASLSRASVYLARTPQGDVAIQYSEGDDPAAAYRYVATSTSSFDKWNRGQLAAIHGVDFSRPRPRLPQLGFDYQNPDLLKEMQARAGQGRRRDQGSCAPPM